LITYRRCIDRYRRFWRRRGERAQFAGHLPPASARRAAELGVLREPRGRVGRGLLADGHRADQPGAGPLQRPRRPTGNRLAAVAGREEDLRDGRCGHIRTFAVEEGRRPVCEDVPTRTIRHGSPARSRRHPAAPPIQSYARRRWQAPEFSVKRVAGGGEPEGEVSNRLHDQVGIGDPLTLSLPYGDVVLDDSGRPVVFASTGIGIALMAGMLSHLVAAESGFRSPCCTPIATRPRSRSAGRW
jgi:hypothetical protein